MTGEERRRTMDFILQQTAQFATGIQRVAAARQKREQKEARREIAHLNTRVTLKTGDAGEGRS